ncbi:MAG TPA: PaaI family thioesterase [Deltaproteobacteria bacterium]|nr:PaaI family thioesterase [Deltaproteobacteria bacterium]HQB38913.1 PaaI family thioesterase [Deltaproteobacteria bacterium]
MNSLKPATIESASAIPMLQTLDIRCTEIGDSYAIMQVTVSDKHRNYIGGAHGGLIATLADTVSFFPRPLFPSGLACTTTNLNLNYIRPAVVGDVLTARSDLIHLGRRMASLKITITNHHGGLVAHGTSTLLITAQ